MFLIKALGEFGGNGWVVEMPVSLAVTLQGSGRLPLAGY